MSKEPKKIFGITLGGKKAAAKEARQATVSVEEKQNFVYTPQIPLVNVIPLSVVEKYQIKGIARKFVFAGVGVLAILGLVFAGGNFYMATQQAKIDELSAKQQELSSQTQALQPYQVYTTSVDGKRQALLNVTGKDVNMGSIYKNLNDSAESNNVVIDNISVVQYQEGAEGEECVNPDPFATTVAVEEIIGCVTLEGKSDNKDQVNGFLDDLANLGEPNETYRNQFVSSFTNTNDSEPGERAATFSATIAFTSALYTNKYSDLSVSLQELITSGAVDSSDSDVTDEVDPEDIAPVEIPDAGTAGLYALTLIPELTEEDVRTIDTIAYATCSTQTTEGAETALTQILMENYPDVDAVAITTQLLAQIDTNCEVILSEQEQQEEEN